MHPRTRAHARLACAAALCALAAPVSLPADEGMWLFNALPVERLAARYGFTPSAQWTHRVMRSACRLSSGGSGSFVSPDGLVLTNHHVGAAVLHKLSTPERNLLKDGFVARSPAEDLLCPDLEIIALAQIEDVTARVNGEVPPGADAAAAFEARRGAIARIEQESQDATGLRSEVMTLYRGGLYHLYRYERYDEVTLVMAPEEAAAFFGGDRDNFEFPRFDLDVCLFRVRRNGAPAKIEHYLTLRRAPLAEGELVFVAGHPGATQRLYTLDHMRFLRDVEMPFRLTELNRREIALQQFALGSAEDARIARDDLFGIQNARKAFRGILAGLLDPRVLAAKAAAEAALRAKVAGDPGLGAALDDWDAIAQSLAVLRGFYGEYQALEVGLAFWSRLYGHALALVRLAAEKEKPNETRLPGYRESDLASLLLRLHSPAPIHPALEQAKLAHSLAVFATTFGGEHPLVRTVLDGKAPEARAADLVGGTALGRPEVRKELAAGGAAAIAASTDAMIVLARTVDPYARAVRKRYEDLYQSVERERYGRIASALFAVHGTDLYPDATYSLRLAYGTVKGTAGPGAPVPFATTIGGAFQRSDAAGGREPYELPASWLAARARLALDTPLNFTCTADIIGGNSGSPVLDRDANLVGVIFDGNRDSLIWDIVYMEDPGRAVAVAAPAILETLAKVYGADAILRELASGGR